MSALLTLWGWKMALYVGLLLLLAWRLRVASQARTRLESALAASERELAGARAQVKELGDALTRSQQVRASQAEALATSMTERAALEARIAAMRPPEDAAGAISWLKTPEAKA
jgi:chromosome segregation ATPase